MVMGMSEEVVKVKEFYMGYYLKLILECDCKCMEKKVEKVEVLIC